MPFKSQAQRGYLFANNPKVAAASNAGHESKPSNVSPDYAPEPLSAKALAALEAGIRSAKEHPSVYLGSFAKYKEFAKATPKGAKLPKHVKPKKKSKKK